MNKRLLNMLLILLIASIYLLDNLLIFTFNKKSFYIYMIKPIIWFCVALIIWRLPKVKLQAKVKYKNFFMEWIIYLAIFYIVMQVLGGFIHGFGKSPYDLTPLGIIQNIILLFSTLVGREKARAYIVNNGSRNKIWLRMVLAVLLFTAVNIPINKLMSLNGSFEIMKYFGEFVLPQLSISIMATYLVYLRGASLSVLYIGIIQAVMYLSPVLPNLKWITSAIIGILCPVFSMIFLQYLYLKETKKLKRREEKKERPIGWIITTLASVLLIWFSMGVFPIYPSVIATGSMRPLISPGDVVLVKRLQEADIKVGDIIGYKKDNIYIFHRVINTVEEKNQIKYQTKGDNNSIADIDLVSVDMIKGKVVNVVPKIGWPALIIKGSRNIVQKEKVEF